MTTAMKFLEKYPKVASTFECLRGFVLFIPVILVTFLMTWSFYVYNTYYILQFFADAPATKSKYIHVLSQ
eukprot:m.257298 g.257298  ORF g.257298 m.257298 type:complete len:70 (+) comp19633_c0_seq2:76-285(+)